VRQLQSELAPGREAEVIHTHAAIPSRVALLLAADRRRAIKIVQTMHGWGVSKTAEQAVTDVALMNLVDRVAVPSLHSANTIGALGVSPERTSVIPYGVSEFGALLDA